jgi:two-component system alkaline phosphatase synthesis response regulator PhoP
LTKPQPKKKVLVADDDEHIVELLELVLQDAGYEVVTAQDGREAIVRAVQDRPDVIILDILMPGLDGWETCEHLLSHEQTASTPIIFLTARVRPEDQLRGWYAGCFDYITKPFEVDQLLRRIHEATESAPAEVVKLRDNLRRQRVAVLEAAEEEEDEDDSASDTPRRTQSA